MSFFCGVSHVVHYGLGSVLRVLSHVVAMKYELTNVKFSHYLLGLLFCKVVHVVVLCVNFYMDAVPNGAAKLPYFSFSTSSVEYADWNLVSLLISQMLLATLPCKL